MKTLVGKTLAAIMVLHLGGLHADAVRAADQAAVATRLARSATETTSILASEISQDRSLIGVLFTESAGAAGAPRVSLLGFDTKPRLQQSSAVPLSADILSGPAVSPRAGLAIDKSGHAYIAVAGTEGVVHLARADLRKPNTAATRIKQVKLGNGSLELTRMLISSKGELILAGSVDDKGFVAALSVEGNPVWTRSFDEGVSKVLDLAEIDGGWVWVGGVPARFASYSLRLGRLGSSGDVKETPAQPVDGDTRFARLTASAGQVGLAYESLRTDGTTSDVYVEIFQPQKKQDTKRTKVFEGQLAAGFTIAPAGDGFVVSGVASGGTLLVDRVGADLAVRQMSRSVVKSPDYRRYHGADVLAGADSLYLAGIESTAAARTQKLELTVSMLEGR